MKPWWMTLALSAVLVACDGPKKTGGGETEETNTEETDTDEGPVNDDGTLATANEIDVPDEGLLIEDEIAFAGDRDFYTFEATAGDSFLLFAQTSTGEGSPDTVLRVYGPDEALLGECDDLPYRIHGTDSGYIFVANTDGPYYVEVLEWSDWADDSPAGDPAWAYNLIIVPAPLYEDDSVNDELQLVVDELDAQEASDEDDQYPLDATFYLDPWTNTDDDTYNYSYFMSGAIGDAGDVDLYGIRFEEDDFEGAGIVEFSMFPGLATEIDAVVELLDAEGNVLVTGGEQEYDAYVSAGPTEGVGFSYLVTEGGDYFVRVTDGSGGGGVDHWYAIQGAFYPFNMDVVTLHETAPASESDYSDGDPLTLTEGELTSGGAYWYGFGVGRFEVADDGWDSFVLTAEGPTEGMFFSVQLGTQELGADLDATVSLWDGGTELVSAETNPQYDTLPDDPAIFDFEIPEGVGDTLYLVIENTNDVDGDASYYQGVVYLSEEEVFTF